jgi:peptidoglycan/xylan/chitin deacetylase (PgdA/CDA1 family)
VTRGARLVRRRDVADHSAGAAGALPPRASAASLAAGRLTAFAAPVHCVEPDRTAPPALALSWDDGPHPEHTPRILDELAAARVRATFFVLVLAAEAHPAVVRRMVAEGHEVALHGIDHRPLTGIPLPRVLRLVGEGRERLQQVVRQPVLLFRPPFGATTTGQVTALRLRGLRTVLWSAWARDWEQADEAELARRALRAVHPGAVLLLHDAYGEALTDPARPGPTFARHLVARAVLAGLAARGVAALPVGELLANHRPVTTVLVRRPFERQR